MDSCAIHYHITTQISRFVAFLQIPTTLFRSFTTLLLLFMVDSTHFEQSFLMSNSLCNVEPARSFDMFAVSINLPSSTFRSFEIMCRFVYLLFRISSILYLVAKSASLTNKSTAPSKQERFSIISVSVGSRLKSAYQHFIIISYGTEGS